VSVVEPAVDAAGPRRLRAAWMVVLAASVTALHIADLLTGPSFLSPAVVLRTMLAPETADAATSAIVWRIRMPMGAMALVVGASLGMAGAAMQTILANPLASPFTLGFSAAAGFGAAAAILAGLRLPLFPDLAVPVAAFTGAMVAAVLVRALAALRGMTSEAMVLAGIAVMFLFQAAQSLLQYMASPEALQQIVFWLFGSLLKASWFTLAVAGTILAAGCLLLLPLAWPLTALRLGDERAAALGVDVPALRRRVFLAVTLLTAGAVCFVGVIGFVGLVAPHVARMLVGEDHRFLLPASAMCGAVLLSGASIAAKLVVPGTVVPIGIVTALVGVPALLVLISVQRRARC